MKKHMGKLGRVTMNKRKGLNMEQKRNLTGWAFLLPASILIFVFCFYPMVQALILIFASVGVVGLFLGDVLMVMVDPRISLTRGEDKR